MTAYSCICWLFHRIYYDAQNHKHKIPLICLNPFTFPTALIHLTSLNYTQYSSPNSKLISKIMNPFTALKNLSPFHFTFFPAYSINPSLHFTLLFISTAHFPSLFTFYRLQFPSLIFTFLTLILKICVSPWEVPIAPSGSLFQSVTDPFTKEYFPMSILCPPARMTSTHLQSPVLNSRTITCT